MRENDVYDTTRARYRKQWLKLVTLVFVFSCAPKQEEITTPEPVIPNGWKPSLERVQEDFKEAVEKNPNKSQRALNRAAQNMADLLDARLFITYVTLIDALEGDAKLKLFKEQEEWLSKRAETAQTAVTSKGGSLAPLEYSGEYRRMTEERLAELRNRLKQGQGPDR